MDQLKLGQAKKAREQTFKDKYKEDFPFITSSKVSDKHAFCKGCNRDFSIAHGGRSDILQHCRTQLHKKSVSVTATTQPSNQPAAGGQQSILSYGYKSKEEDKATIRAECLFAAFYVEHNIPLAVADHMNQLLRSAFPNSEEVKKFRSGRTKTSCLIKEMARDKTNSVIATLKNTPFSIATDGSHTCDSKLYLS